MSNFIKFKLRKDEVKGEIYFTLIDLNTKHKVVLNSKGYSICFSTKKVKSGRRWDDFFVNDTIFSIYFADYSPNLNHKPTLTSQNSLFMISKNSNYNNIEYTFVPPNNQSLDFWCKRIVDSFKILSKYGK